MHVSNTNLYIKSVYVSIQYNVRGSQHKVRYVFLGISKFDPMLFLVMGRASPNNNLTIIIIIQLSSALMPSVTV